MTSLRLETKGLTATYTFTGEGHTLGNLMSREVQKHKQVEFAGYNVPHPLEDEMIVTVMTSTGDPKEIVREAMIPVVDRLDCLEAAFHKALE